MTKTIIDIHDIIQFYQKTIEKRGMLVAEFNFDILKKEITKIAADKNKHIGYSSLLDEYVREIKNSIMDLAGYCDRLNSWIEIFLAIDSDKSPNIYYGIILEFIAPIAELALQHPYAIRSRFIFALVKLDQYIRYHDHQENGELNIIKDRDIDHTLMCKKCAEWKAFKKFNRALEKIIGKEFSEETKNFRNEFHHQFPVKIEFGITKLTKIEYSYDGTIITRFEGDSPLCLEKIVSVLKKSVQNSINVYDKFVDIINEFTEHINLKY